MKFGKILFYEFTEKMREVFPLRDFFCSLRLFNQNGMNKFQNSHAYLQERVTLQAGGVTGGGTGTGIAKAAVATTVKRRAAMIFLVTKDSLLIVSNWP